MSKIIHLTIAFGFAMGASILPWNSHPPLPEAPIRLSYYWPDMGGTNCHSANWDQENKTCNAMLYGKPWQEWEDIGAACPAKYALGTKLWIHRLHRVVICVDRGGGIVTLPDNTSFIDLLQRDGIWVEDWRERIIKDKWCPSGCYWSGVSVIRR